MHIQLSGFAFFVLTFSLSMTPSRAAAIDVDSWHKPAPPELTQAARDELTRVNAAAQLPFHAEVSRVTRAARVIAGGSFATGAIDHEQAALNFLREHASLFALPTNLTMSTLVRGDFEPRVYVSFELQGLAVEGMYATVLFDSLRNIRAITVSSPSVTQIAGAFELGESQARAAARAAIDAHRARSRRTQVLEWREPVVKQVYIATERGLTAAYRAEVGAKSGVEAYITCVDGQTGASLRLVDNVYHATGHYPNFTDHYPNTLNFSTTTATGNVYKNQADSIGEHKTKQDLKNWSKGIPSPFNFVKGFLTGARGDVYDANNQNVFNATGKFNFSPTDPAQADFFDQVNLYYQIETFYGHLKSVLKTDLGSNFSIPLIVNVPAEEINAFFSPAAPPDGFGHSLGHMQFFDFSQIAGPAGDVSRDSVAADHEYTHCWIHFQGESFQDPGDFPTRAVGEAIPDFFASTFAKDTQVGRYLGELFPGNGFPRDLQDDDHFPETTIDAINITGDLPEEHRNGEIVGAFLTDLRLEIGASTSERLVFKALPLMPNSMTELGIQTITQEAALGVTDLYFGECVKALLNSTTSETNLAAIVGAATGRGIIGTQQTIVDFTVDLEPLSKRKITYPSRFVTPDPQGYLFAAKPGRKLTVTIKASTGSDVLPDFDIVNPNGLTNPTTASTPKTFSSGGHKVEQKNIQLNLPEDETYLIIVSSGGPGRYTLTLDA